MARRTDRPEERVLVLALFGRDATYTARILESPGPARTGDYLLVAGAQDPRYRAAAQTFAAELDRLGVRHQLFVIPGGHEGSVWTEGLVTCLQVLKAQLPAATHPLR